MEVSLALVMHALSYYKPVHCKACLTADQGDLLFTYHEISSVGCSDRQRMVAQRTDHRWDWKRTAKVFKQEEQHKRANKQTDNVIHVLVLYPSVLMNPFTVPSAKSETISPICRKLVCCAILQQRKLRIYARRISQQFQHWNSTKMRTRQAQSSCDFHSCFFALLYKGIQRKNKQTEYKQVV